MKRKLLVTILSLTMGLSIVACGKQETTATTETIPTTVESTEVETTEEVKETETVENTATEEETETVEEQTEPTEVVEETTEVVIEGDFALGEPISEKDLNFPFLGYDTYIDYIKAGNSYSAYIIADNAKMIETGEFIDEGDTIESTVRGIKLGDNIEKILEVYGQADAYDTYGRDCFSHDGKRDEVQYLYFFKTDLTKDYFYSFRFIIDQNNELIGFILEPMDIKYWSE